MLRLVNLLKESIEKDESRILKYEKRLESLPKGSIHCKNRNGKVYFYFRYVQDGKRKDKYVRLEDLDNLKSQLEERKWYEEMIKGFKENMRIAKKGIEYSSGKSRLFR